VFLQYNTTQYNNIQYNYIDLRRRNSLLNCEAARQRRRLEKTAVGLKSRVEQMTFYRTLQNMNESANLTKSGRLLGQFASDTHTKIYSISNHPHAMDNFNICNLYVLCIQ